MVAITNSQGDFATDSSGCRNLCIPIMILNCKARGRKAPLLIRNSSEGISSLNPLPAATQPEACRFTSLHHYRANHGFVPLYLTYPALIKCLGSHTLHGNSAWFALRPPCLRDGVDGCSAYYYAGCTLGSTDSQQRKKSESAPSLPTGSITTGPMLCTR